MNDTTIESIIKFYGCHHQYISFEMTSRSFQCFDFRKISTRWNIKEIDIGKLVEALSGGVNEPEDLDVDGCDRIVIEPDSEA